MASSGMTKRSDGIIAHHRMPHTCEALSLTPSFEGVAMRPGHAPHDVHRHVKDGIAPPRYRLEQPTHGLGSRSQHHRTEPPRRPGQRKALPLASARRLELGGLPRRHVVVMDFIVLTATLSRETLIVRERQWTE